MGRSSEYECYIISNGGRRDEIPVLENNINKYSGLL
jgi:hypothetical protein